MHGFSCIFPFCNRACLDFSYCYIILLRASRSQFLCQNPVPFSVAQCTVYPSTSITWIPACLLLCMKAASGWHFAITTKLPELLNMFLELWLPSRGRGIFVMCGVGSEAGMRSFIYLKKLRAHMSFEAWLERAEGVTWACSGRDAPKICHPFVVLWVLSVLGYRIEFVH